VLYIHALNPYGFSWWRRVTNENVDLNRNWHDFSKPLPANPAYDAIAEALVPAQWPPSAQSEQRLAALVAEHGPKALQAAITGGQHAHPQGLFFGGQAPTWSQQTLRQVLREHGRRARQIAWIDLHTGLGPNGHGELIFACRDDAAALARAKAFQQALKQELMAAMAEGGPVRAVAVCSERAPALAQAASTDGWRLRRVGTKTRNITNSPSKADGEALDRLLADATAPFVRSDGAGDGDVHWRHYVPLRVEAACLLCHGQKAGMSSELQQALAARYPQDDAVGYALGDLRGAIVVEMLR